MSVIDVCGAESLNTDISIELILVQKLTRRKVFFYLESWALKPLAVNKRINLGTTDREKN